MKITIYGCELTGLVTSGALASTGNHVVGVPVGTAKAEQLQQGILPREEPGLPELIRAQVAEGRLSFTADWEAGMAHGELFFLSMPSWRAHRAEEVVALLGQKARKPIVLIVQTTFPVGTAEKFEAMLKMAFAERGVSYPVTVVVMPEFISEGTAIQNFTHPDRIVLGAESDEAVEVMKDLMRPFNRLTDQMKLMSLRAAEYTKYAVNALLATRISLVNELANNAEKFGVDMEEVRQGVGSDSRIGFSYLYPGTGFGGASFAADVQMLLQNLREKDSDVDLLQTVLEINEAQKEVTFRKAWRYFGADLRGIKVAVWGLAFKPNTDTIANAPSLKTIESFLAQGAKVQAYDPKANHSFAETFGEHPCVSYCEDMYQALKGVDALVILTEWKHFWTPDYDQMKQYMVRPVIFDGRNIYEPQVMNRKGFEYFGVGRGTIV